jgi:capsular exopolysaccharide synthesis family protein
MVPAKTAGELVVHNEGLAGVPQPAGPFGLPPALGSPLNARTLLLALRRCWIRASVIAGLCAAVVAVVLWFVLPPARYTAQALLTVSPNLPKNVINNGNPTNDFASFQRAQVQQVKSRDVLRAALEDPRVLELEHQRSANWLKENLVVDYTLGPETLRVALSCEDPEEAATFVNAVTDAYLREFINKDRDARTSRIDQLTKSQARFEKDLSEKLQALHDKAKVAGSVNQAEREFKFKEVFELLGDQQKILDKTRVDLAKIQAELTVQQEKGKATEEAVVSPSAVEEFQAKDKILIELHELEVKQRGIVAALQPNNPSTKKDADKLESLRSAIAERKKELHDTFVKQKLGMAEFDAQLRRKDLQEQLTVLKKMEESLSARVEHLKEQIKADEDVDLVLGALQKEIEKIDGMSRKVTTEVEALRVDLDTSPQRVTLFEEAEVPVFKDQKKRFQYLGLGTVGTFGLVLLGFALWEWRVKRVGTASDVSDGLGISVVGALPVLPERTVRRLPGGERATRDLYWHNLMAASVDNTSAMLLYAKKLAAHRVMMITSALPGEGKTTLASHLAASLARAGHSTLLIDFDLRKPSLHRLFDQVPEPGLRELLRGEASLEEVIRPTILGGLSLIGTREWAGTALQILSQSRLAEILEQLKPRYEFIVVDSAPVLPAADSLLIARHVDAVLFSILRDVSRIPTVHTAYQRLASVGVPILGAVVHGTNNEVYGSGYQYSAGYGTTTPA